VLFLCYNPNPPASTAAPSGVPTPPICPTASPATVTGTLTQANVIPLSAQGIDAGAAGFAEMIQAIKHGAAYVNVHSTLHPGGEIRGRLGGGRGGDERKEHEGHEGHEGGGHEGH
jgi:CHRD domain